MARVVDLTLPIYPNLPVPPGTSRVVDVKRIMTFDSQYKRNASSLTLYSQFCTTHIDAPNHAIPNGFGIDKYDLEKHLIGKAYILDLRHVPPGHRVTVDDLKDAITKTGRRFPRGCMLGINTGWTDRSWGKPEFFEQMITLDAPSVGEFLADLEPRALLTDSYNDTWEGFLSADWALNHQPLLAKEIPLVEYCQSLHALDEGDWEIYALPLKIIDCDGAPARVIAVNNS
jgi:arylformamidase